MQTDGVQFITPFVAQPKDVENRARIPSHVVSGLYTILCYQPWVDRDDYSELVAASVMYLSNPEVKAAYVWLRDNRSQFELGSTYGFIVYEVN